MVSLSLGRQVGRAGLVAAGAAAIVNSAIFLMGQAAEVSFLVPSFGSEVSRQEVTLAQVIFSSLIPLILGTALALFIVSRGRGVTAAQVVGAAVALLSVAVPLSLEAESSTRLLLASMHIAAGVTFVVGLQRVKRDAPVGSSRVAADSPSQRVA